MISSDILLHIEECKEWMEEPLQLAGCLRGPGLPAADYHSLLAEAQPPENETTLGSAMDRNPHCKLQCRDISFVEICNAFMRLLFVNRKYLLNKGPTSELAWLLLLRLGRVLP